MLSFFRKKNSESDVVTRIGAVRSVTVAADVSSCEFFFDFWFVYI